MTRYRDDDDREKRQSGHYCINAGTFNALTAMSGIIHAIKPPKMPSVPATNTASRLTGIRQPIWEARRREFVKPSRADNQISTGTNRVAASIAVGRCVDSSYLVHAERSCIHRLSQSLAATPPRSKWRSQQLRRLPRIGVMTFERSSVRLRRTWFVRASFFLLSNLVESLQGRRSQPYGRLDRCRSRQRLVPELLRKSLAARSLATVADEDD